MAKAEKIFIAFRGLDIYGRPCGVYYITRIDSIDNAEGALLKLHEGVTSFLKKKNPKVHIVSCEKCTDTELVSLFPKENLETYLSQD